MSRLEFRSVWISDVHLGTRDAQVAYLLDFLRHVKCDYLYLVGDIIDIWKVKSGWYWPALNNELIRDIISWQPMIDLKINVDDNWLTDPFGEGVSELSFEVNGIISDLQRLKDLYELFAELLNHLCHIGSAYEDDPLL